MVLGLRMLQTKSARANPFGGNERAIAVGRKLFREHCASCHGKNAEGKNSKTLFEVQENPARPSGRNPMAPYERRFEKWDAFVGQLARAAEMANRCLLAVPRRKPVDSHSGSVPAMNEAQGRSSNGPPLKMTVWSKATPVFSRALKP